MALTRVNYTIHVWLAKLASLFYFISIKILPAKLAGSALLNYLIAYFT